MLLRMAAKRNQARSQCQNVKCKEKVVETILFECKHHIPVSIRLFQYQPERGTAEQLEIQTQSCSSSDIVSHLSSSHDSFQSVRRVTRNE